jgi:hypothetical protein
MIKRKLKVATWEEMKQGKNTNVLDASPENSNM